MGIKQGSNILENDEDLGLNKGQQRTQKMFCVIVDMF